MRASPGDRILVHPPDRRGPRRDGRVLAVRGADGGPPYVVEWAEDGHVSLFFPGEDAHVHHTGQQD
jgi:hypothetical protein